MIVVNESTCPKNHFCPVMRLCPVGAITQDGPFSAPQINQARCIQCRKCVLACGTFQEQESPVMSQ